MNKRFLSFLLSAAVVISSITVGSPVSADSFESIYADDGSETISYDGSWQSVTDSSAYGGGYHESSGGKATVSLPVKSNGYYKVYLRYPADTALTGALRIDVTDGDKKQYSTQLSQKINGGYWVYVGTYFLTKTGKQKLDISAADGGKIALDGVRTDMSSEQSNRAKETLYSDSGTKADVVNNETKVSFGDSLRHMYSNLLRVTSMHGKTAEKEDNKAEEKTETDKKEESGTTAAGGERNPITIVKNADSPSGENEQFMTVIGDEMIVDNTSSYFTTLGSGWQTLESKEAYGGTYCSDGDSGSNMSAGAKWTLRTAVAGKYKVWIKWPSAADRSGAAAVSIKNYYGVVDIVTVDQREPHEDWLYLGEYDMGAAKTSNIVSVRCNDTGITVADAVKIQLTEFIDPEFGVYSPTRGCVPQQSGHTSDTHEWFNIVTDDNGKFMLTKDGAEFFVNGADISGFAQTGDSIAKFAECGGNMIRTYGLEGTGTQDVLDFCYENGVYVAAGVTISREQSTYATKEAYRKYINSQKELIQKYKDHPALAMWVVNNEAEGKDVDGEIFAAIEELSRYIHSIDCYHPVLTAIAGPNTTYIGKMMSQSPGIDIMGINAYSAVGRCEEATRTKGWNAPYMVTEYGPNGTWGTECDRTEWNVVIDMNNDEKADIYRERHEEYIKGIDRSIGGFAFCLPYAVGTEGTYSWYGFWFDGCSTPVMDEMCYAWTRAYPDNVAPRIKKFNINSLSAHDNITLQPGESMTLNMEATDADGDAVQYKFGIYEEVNLNFTAKEAQMIYEAENASNANTVTISAPTAPGYYRLFFKAYDGNGHVGIDNIPFRVVRSETESKDNTKVITELLTKAAAQFDGGFSASVDVNANDNNQGIPYEGKGSATVEANADAAHIISDVTYDVGGRENCEVYLTKDTSYISADGKNYEKYDANGYQSMSGVYNAILSDKNLLKNLRYDDSADKDYYIISGQILVPGFNPYALSGLKKDGFIGSDAGADNYFVKIYVSRTSGKIDKTVATVGYMRSAENAQYRKLSFTYNYEYGKSVKVDLPK